MLNRFDLFASKINYNTVQGGVPGVGALYNGNIAETYWRTASDDIKRKYGYKYDSLNRLKEAIYQKPDDLNPTPNSYNETLTYDKNGNITTLRRNGDLDDPSTVFQIDNLSYFYPANSNRLSKVTDLTNNTSGFKDDSNGTNDTSDDYGYDTNGNLTKDENKGITTIKYNHLNLPTEIIFTGTNKKINYLYNAVGQKIKKTVTSGTSITHIDYLSGYQYRQIGTGTVVLDFFPHAEGYVSNTVVSGVNNYNYVFNYTDHLGNIRLSYTKDPVSNELKILEENNYYPFGLKHNNYNWDKSYYDAVASGQILIRKTPRLVYQYKFGGNEFQDELGLNVYDYDNRIYDQATGRFWQMDPLAENGRRWSPYNYCFDNPIYFQDPDGMWPKIPSWSDIKKTYNEAKASVVSTYNQAKATVAKTYNEAKATVTKTYNETKASVAKTYNETKATVAKAYNETKKAVVETANKTQEWVKENKTQIISVAKEIQDIGDKTTTTGLVAAAAGAPLAGVGASPGLAVATAGGIVSTIGEVLEIGTNLIAGDVTEGAGGAAVYVAEELAGMAVDRAIPGPNPDVAPQVKELIKATHETVKNMASDKTKDVANQVRQ